MRNAAEKKPATIPSQKVSENKDKLREPRSLNPIWQQVAVHTRDLSAKAATSSASSLQTKTSTIPSVPLQFAAATHKQPSSTDTIEELWSIEQIVARATSGPGTALPFLEEIQNAFGQDLSTVKAHLDPAAAHAASTIGAEAFTAGEHIVFSRPPTLEIAAHEATHVIQQRDGVDLPDGVGHIDDQYERQANEVARHIASEASFADTDQSELTGLSVTPTTDVATSPATSVPAGVNQNSVSSLAPSSLSVTSTKGNHSAGVKSASNAPISTFSSPDSGRMAEPSTFGEFESQLQPNLSGPTHTLAMAVAPTVIQKDGTDDVKGAVVNGKVGDVTYNLWQDQGLLSLSLAGEPWVTVRWTPQASGIPDFLVVEEQLGYGVKVNASVDLRVTVNRTIEEAYGSRILGGLVFAHKYVAKGAKVIVNQHLPGGITVTGEGDYLEQKKYEGHDIYVHVDVEGVVRPGQPGPNLYEPPPFWWEFDRIEQLDLFAASHPNHYWLAFQPSAGGRLRALNLTEEHVQGTAEEFRNDPEIAAAILSLYENGKAWPDINALYFKFFDTDIAARRGAPGDAPECIIYKHATKSYGRKALTHIEALQTWSTLEFIATSLGTDAALTYDVDGEGEFWELVARGSSGIDWEIDHEYFELREVFFLNVEQLAAGYGKSWKDLFHENLAVWEHYGRRAVDREEIAMDPNLRAVMDSDTDFLREAGRRVYERVEQYAYHLAYNAVDSSMEGLLLYTEETKLQNLVLQFPEMTAKERDDTLTFLAVPWMFRPLYLAALSDPEQAALVMMGETVYGIVSLNGLKQAVQSQLPDLQNALESIRSHKIEPLEMQDEFGVSIREKTYQDLGFKLNPASFPHEDEAAWRKDQPEGTRYGVNYSPYGSEAGYLFAWESARRASEARTVSYILLAVTIVASVALVIVSAGIGAAVAGIWFSTTTTLASFIGFTITEVAVSAAVVTLVSPALTTFTMSGFSLDPELYSRAYSWKGLGKQFGINLLTFGYFKVLGLAIRSASVIGAGGEKAFLNSSRWQMINNVSRIGVSTASMFAISIVTHRLEEGKWPEGESLFQIAFETGLSVILLETGGFLARNQMAKIQEWAESQRLGKDVAKRMKALKIEVMQLNRQTAAFSRSPLGGEKHGLDLLQRQQKALEEQKFIIAELKKSVFTRADADILNKFLADQLVAIDARIDAISGVQALGHAEVRPAREGGNGVDAEFTYKRGREQDLKDYYGEQNVRVVGNHLEVDFHGMTLIFRPATNVAAGILPDGSRTPDTLNAWRTSALARMRKIIDRASALKVNEAVFRDVVNGDPRTMDVDAMKTFEAKLDRAETRLDTLERPGPRPTISIAPEANTKAWRLRLVDAREQVLERARLLGVESAPEIKEMSRLPMRRGDVTSAETVENYRLAIEKGRALVDAVQKQVTDSLDAATAGPPPDIDVLKAKLKSRRADVLRRAKAYDAAKREYITKVKNLKLGGTDKVGTLSESEAAIAAAEAKLDKMALEAFEAAKVTHGEDVINEVRTGAHLEKLTDWQVGDVMRQLASAKKLSPKALRGALLTRLAPEVGESLVNLENIAKFARNHDQLESVLTTFAEMRDAQIGNAFKLIADAGKTRDSWTGTVWQMELARDIIGIENIQAFELKITTTSGNREIDIVLKNGQVIETKDWRNWKPDTVKSQFFRDLEHNTRDGADATGIEKILWKFRNPAPTSVATIRATMRAALEEFIFMKGLLEPKADALRDAFDAHLDLIEVPKIDATQVVKSSPPTYVPPPPPISTGDDKDK